MLTFPTYPLDLGHRTTGVLQPNLTGIQFSICYALGYHGGECFSFNALLHQMLQLGHALESLYETAIEVAHSFSAQSLIVFDSTRNDGAQDLARQWCKTL